MPVPTHGLAWQIRVFDPGPATAWPEKAAISLASTFTRGPWDDALPTGRPTMQKLTDPHLLDDIAEIGRIQAVPRILETVAHITGSRFTAIARVTQTTWTACATC